jgi:hypothetical protein
MHGKNKKTPSEKPVRPTKSYGINRLSVPAFEHKAICKMKDLNLSVFCTLGASCRSCTSTLLVNWQAADDCPAAWLGPHIIINAA